MIGLKDTSRTSSETRNFQIPGEHWDYTSSRRPLRKWGQQRKERRRRSDAFTDWPCFLRTVVTRSTAYRKINKHSFLRDSLPDLGGGSYLSVCTFFSSLSSVSLNIPAGAQSWTLWQWASRSWAWLMRAYPFSRRTVNHFALGWLLVAMQLKSTGCVTKRFLQCFGKHGRHASIYTLSDPLRGNSFALNCLYFCLFCRDSLLEWTLTCWDSSWFFFFISAHALSDC